MEKKNLPKGPLEIDLLGNDVESYGTCGHQPESEHGNVRDAHKAADMGQVLEGTVQNELANQQEPTQERKRGSPFLELEDGLFLLGKGHVGVDPKKLRQKVHPIACKIPFPLCALSIE